VRAGGYAPGKLIENDTMALTKEQTDWFLREIEGNKFWAAAVHSGYPGGCDGSQWVIEGIKNCSYHSVDRWTPREAKSMPSDWR
jgi:hypothetical protein